MIAFDRLRAQYDTAASLLDRGGASAHFVGIGGVGMAGLATLLHARGLAVSGCDPVQEAPTLRALRTLGIPVAHGHNPAHLRSLPPGSFVVRTPAAPPDAPELAAATRASLPVLDRGPVLAALLDASPTPLVAVCGTHGKTTTATFAASLFRSFGLAPGWCIGSPDGAAEPGGAASGAFVAECDESDGSLALYHPAVAVIGSVDFDHAEHFGSENEFLSVFDTLLRQTSRAVVYNADDARLAAFLARHAPPGLPIFAVGTGPDARLRATTPVSSADGLSFDLALDGAPLGRFRLPVPGLHNLRNALAALAAALALLPPSASVPADLRARLPDALARLRLPSRRFEVVSTADGVRVIADYAHHPAEIAALVSMARETGDGQRKTSPSPRLIALFQPHRYSRTKALGPDFVAALAGLDALALAPVYAASEPPVPGGDIADLYALFRDAGASPALLPTLSSALPWLRSTVRPGDTVLLIGAGDIISLASAFRDGWTAPRPLPPALPGLAVEPAVAAAPLCSYGVGGPVRALVRVANPAALPPLLAWCRDTGTPWRVIGAGTNLLVSDAGWDGLLLRLEGPAFTALEPLPDGAWRVGAALPGARLLAEWTRRGLAGLECMDGIPGTIGGWLAMNAGAQGRAVGERVRSVAAVADHPVSAPRFGYRTSSLTDCVIVSAELVPEKRATTAEVENTRAGFRAKRYDFAGQRTAGSVFRNPPGDSAGRILDAAGLKGLCVGGAEVSPRHANIFVARPGATASDLLALLRLARLRSPVPLNPEIVLL